MNDKLKEFFETTGELLEFRKGHKQNIKTLKWEIHKLEKEQDHRARDISQDKKIKMTDENFNKILQRDIQYIEIVTQIANLKGQIKLCEDTIVLTENVIREEIEKARSEELFCVNYGKLYAELQHLWHGVGIAVENDLEKVLGNILWDFYTEKNSKEECSNRIIDALMLKLKFDSRKDIPVKISKKLKGDFKMADYIERSNNGFNLNKVPASKFNFVFDPEQILEIKKNVYLKDKDGSYKIGSERLRDLLNAICSCLDFDLEQELGMTIAGKAKQE